MGIDAMKMPYPASCVSEQAKQLFNIKHTVHIYCQCYTVRLKHIHKSHIIPLSSPYMWARESDIAYVSGDRCGSHIPRKRGLGSGKPLAMDTQDTPNPDKLVRLNPAITHLFSHTSTKHSNTISHRCSHALARLVFGSGKTAEEGWAMSIMYGKRVYVCAHMHRTAMVSWKVFTSCQLWSFFCVSRSLQIFHACENWNTLYIHYWPELEWKKKSTRCTQVNWLNHHRLWCLLL